MWVRILAGTVPMLTGALIYSGAIPVRSLLGSSNYTADVTASPDRVKGALADLNMDEITKSGMTMGAYPNTLSYSATPTNLTWKLMVDGKEMLDLVATLTPTNDGKGTHLVAETRQGPDYDENKLARGLQDKPLINTIFGAALDQELNEFAAPAQRKSLAQLRQDRMAIVMRAMQAKLMSNPMAVAVEARQREVEFNNQMQQAQAMDAARTRQEAATKGVTFKPGAPMVDVTKPTLNTNPSAASSTYARPSG